MEKLNAKRILVRVGNTGPIPELHFISGPVSKCRVDERTLYRMVRNGKTVYELNPENPSEEVRLTCTNMTTRHFEKKESFVEASKKLAAEITAPVVEAPAEEKVEEPVEVETVIPTPPQTNAQNNQYNGKKNGKKHQKWQNQPAQNAPAATQNASSESALQTPDL